MEDKWGGYLKERSLLGPSTSYRYLPSSFVFHRIYIFCFYLLPLAVSSPSFKSVTPKAVVKNLPANAGGTKEICSIPGWGRSPGRGRGNPLQYSILAWRIPWTEELGRLQSLESQRVRHNWSDLEHMHAPEVDPTRLMWWRTITAFTSFSGISRWMSEVQHQAERTLSLTQSGISTTSRYSGFLGVSVFPTFMSFFPYMSFPHLYRT